MLGRRAGGDADEVAFVAPFVSLLVIAVPRPSACVCAGVTDDL